VRTFFALEGPHGQAKGSRKVTLNLLLLILVFVLLHFTFLFGFLLLCSLRSPRGGREEKKVAICISPERFMRNNFYRNSSVEGKVLTGLQIRLEEVKNYSKPCSVMQRVV
jgi:hypothetical protein